MTNTASEQSTFTIGQPIRDSTEHDALPLGTVVHNHEHETMHYIRVEGGYQTIRDGEPRGAVLATRYFESPTYYISSLPDAAPVHKQAGEDLLTWADFEALPIGTRIGHRTISFPCTKTEEGWRRVDHGTLITEHSFMFGEGNNYVVSLPEAETVAEFTVGQVLDGGRDQYRRLPVGTVLVATAEHRDMLGLSPDLTYTAGEDGYIVSITGYSNSWDTCREDRFFQIQSLPDAAPAPEAPATLQFTIGQDIVGHDTMRSLPVGTGFQRVRHDGTLSSTVWTRVEGDLIRGQAEQTYPITALSNTNTYRIMALPAEMVQPLNPEPRPFQVGDRVRAADPAYQGTDQGYVSPAVFGQEGVIRRGPDLDGDFDVRFATTSQLIHPDYLTLVEEETPRFTVGQELHQREEFAALPIGTVHEYRYHDDRIVQYTKIGDNEWRTSEGDTRGGTFAAQGNRIVSLPDAAPAAPAFTVGQAATREVIEALPVGASLRLSTLGDHSRTWVKQEDGSLHLEGGGGVQTARAVHFGDGWIIASLPDAAPAFTVGQRITGREMVDALPLGTKVNLWDSGRRTTRNPFVKRESDFGLTETDGRVTGTYLFSDFGHDGWYIQELPDGAAPSSTVEPTPEFTVGQVVRVEMMDRLPVGAGLHTRADHPSDNRSGVVFKYGQDDWRFDGSITRYRNRDIGAGWFLVILPEPDQIPIWGTPTFDQHVWRCRTVIRSALVANGFNTTRPDAAFEKLGVTERTACEGMKIQGYDPYLATVPVGTVVTDAEGSQWVKQAHQWRNLQRSRTTVNFTWDSDVTVVATPEDQDTTWLTAAGTGEDQRRIEEFNAQAVRLGRGLKESEGYCGVYEQTMERLGLNPYTDGSSSEDDEDDEPERENVTVTVGLRGTSSAYWDDEFRDILGGGVSVDNPMIDIQWTLDDIEVEVEVNEGECACEQVTQEMVEGHVENIAEVSDWSIDSTSCSNC